ncbi:MAG: hypothetical protein IKC39_02875 [Clostridia bacterium]|nr:hypothetical protein [Clostridia bacterium]
MTGKELFDIALDLCGLRKPDGTIPKDAEDLHQRALSLINLLLAENAEIDCRIRRIEHKTSNIVSLDDRLDCSDIIASSVLPYGLARLLILGEDDALASNFHNLYTDARNRATRFGKARAEAITEVYK